MKSKSRRYEVLLPMRFNDGKDSRGAIMLKSGILTEVICVVLVTPVAADEPKKSDNKTVLITKEKLLGKWEGPKDVPVTLEFAEKKVKVTVVTTEGGVRKTTIVEWDYEIDVKGNYAKLQPFDAAKKTSLGWAELNAEGTLSAEIASVPPTIPELMKKPATFMFVKPKDAKK